MSAQPLGQQTYLSEQPVEVAEVLSFFAAHDAVLEAKPARRYFLVVADEDERVEIPELVHAVLRQALEAMKAGKAAAAWPSWSVRPI